MDNTVRVFSDGEVDLHLTCVSNSVSSARFLSRSAAVLESTFGFFEFEHNLNEVSLDAPRAFA